LIYNRYLDAIKGA